MRSKKHLISITELAQGLDIDRSNLKKLAIKLKIEKKQIRGKRNQWTQAFSTADVDTILDYRDGIDHNLVRTNDAYKLK